MDYYELLDNGMTPEEMLSEGLIDVFDLPYDPRTDEDKDEDDSTYYGDVRDPDYDENEIRF